MAIASQDLDRMLFEALNDLPGVSLSALKHKLFDVLHTFFNDSSSWLEDIDFTTVKDLKTYTLVPKEDGMIIRLAGIQDANGQVQGAIMPTLGNILLQLAPSGGDVFTATVIKNVTQPTTRNDAPIGPDWVLPLWEPYIRAGLTGAMMLQPNKPYSDKTTATYHLRQYRDGIAQARSETLRRFTVGGGSWLFPQAWRTRSQRSGVSAGNEVTF
jgi:hypothetical protein